MLTYESTSAAKNASFFRCGIVIIDMKTSSNSLLEGLALAVDAELDALLNVNNGPGASREARTSCVPDSTI